MYQVVSEDGKLEHLLEKITSNFQELWKTNNSFEIFPAHTLAPKTIKINIELH